MSSHNLGMFSYTEKLNDDDEDYHSNPSDSTENDSDHENDLLVQEEIARTQQLRLQERLLVLERTLNNLRHQVREEREMWRREVDEMSNYCNGMCYEASGDVGAIRTSYDAFQNSNVSLDLEAKAQHASDSYKDRKAALQRQIAYSNFQRRLLEVENMCNLELLRVKQSAQFLEPLRVMVSEWNKPSEYGGNSPENNSSAKPEVEEEVVEVKKQKDVSDAVELIGSKLYNEINEMFNKVTPTAWLSSSEESTVISNNSSSSGTYMSDSSPNSSN